MKHTLPFDPAYGYTLETLLAVAPPEAPGDFREFWEKAYRTARSIVPDVRVGSRWMAGAFSITQVDYASWEGQRIGGWLVEPQYGEIQRFAVVGHGYSHPFSPSGPFYAGEVTLYLCSRGFGRSRSERIPGDYVKHVVHGIESRETYVHLGCTADVWASVSALLALFPTAAGRISYRGSSFGGGIGALAAPWEERVKAWALDIPSFGNQPLRLQLPCLGSGEAVRQRVAREPHLREVLAYFDAAVAASHIRHPTLVAAALFDPAVPPPGQFCVYNALTALKNLIVRPAAHFDWPGAVAEDALRVSETRTWVAAQLGEGEG